MLLATACCSHETRLAADRYALLKQHFMLHEWTIVCDESTSIDLLAEGPQVAKAYVGGVVLEEGEHVLWIQWDFNGEVDTLIYHLPPTTTITGEHIFGGSFRVVEPEGRIERVGSIRLLESYDKAAAIYLRIKPARRSAP